MHSIYNTVLRYEGRYLDIHTKYLGNQRPTVYIPGISIVTRTRIHPSLPCFPPRKQSWKLIRPIGSTTCLRPISLPSPPPLANRSLLFLPFLSSRISDRRCTAAVLTPSLLYRDVHEDITRVFERQFGRWLSTRHSGISLPIRPAHLGPEPEP